MNSFLNLPVRAKLFTVFGVLIVLFSVAIAVAYASINSLLAAQEEVREKQSNVTDLGRVLARHIEARVDVLTMLTSTDRAEQQQRAEQIRRGQGTNTATLQQLRERNAGDTVFLDLLRSHDALRDEHVAMRSRVVELALAGEVAEARRISIGENHQRYLKMRELIDAMVANAEAATTQALQKSRETVAKARTVFIAAGAAVVVFTLLGVLALGRMIANPLQDLLAVAQRVATGDLKVTVPMTERRDELGALAQSFAAMLENFRSVHRDIQDGVNVLATSASEIFTATAQIATSATETATAVSQTTATAEEVKQTAQVAAQKAGNVADIAQRAAQSAQVGRKAIDESITGMSHVREQMELIAETVVRLSEQSQAIGEIIASVNDLAEQSNLLAVNASIEAAKAGEHGRGFAVVAQEIRSLATQSKESTGQIRTILNDIQRATTATVMAAEQGSKAVDTGVKQVNQSGEAIRTLAESIVAAAQAATQITASAQEQLIGIDQVTIAIQNILQASKQNATGTQQAETGAKNLNQLGQNLRTIVQKFTV
jgi:methyl-accepting chemotaxis protein